MIPLFFIQFWCRFAWHHCCMSQFQPSFSCWTNVSHLTLKHFCMPSSLQLIQWLQGLMPQSKPKSSRLHHHQLDWTKPSQGKNNSCSFYKWFLTFKVHSGLALHIEHFLTLCGLGLNLRSSARTQPLIPQSWLITTSEFFFIRLPILWNILPDKIRLAFYACTLIYFCVVIIFLFFFFCYFIFALKFFIAAFPSYLMLFYVVDLFLNGSFAVFFLFCNRKKTFFFFRSLYHYQNIFQMCFILLCYSKNSYLC